MIMINVISSCKLLLFPCQQQKSRQSAQPEIWPKTLPYHDHKLKRELSIDFLSCFCFPCLYMMKCPVLYVKVGTTVNSYMNYCSSLLMSCPTCQTISQNINIEVTKTYSSNVSNIRKNPTSPHSCLIPIFVLYYWDGVHCDCIGGWCAAGASVRWAVRIREYQTCLASPVQSVQCHQSSTTANNGSDTHPWCKSDGNNQKHFHFLRVEDIGCKIDKKWKIVIDIALY